MPARPLHCALSPVCTAPRQGCVCPPCALTRRGLKDDFDAEDQLQLALAQRGHRLPRLKPESGDRIPERKDSAATLSGIRSPVSAIV